MAGSANAAKKKLLGGAAVHDEVVTKNRKHFLRVATPLPVVLEKCAMCHAKFKGNNDVIGTLAYTVPFVE